MTGPEQDVTDMQIKMLALDLDGTLTDSEKKVTPRTAQDLALAAEKGVRIVLASGRPTAGCSLWHGSWAWIRTAAVF